MLGKISSCCNEDVVYVDDDVSRGNFFYENGVHHCLEYS
jgi:hypothetical protein